MHRPAATPYGQRMLSVAVLALPGGASIGPAGLMDVLAKADRSWRLMVGPAWTPLFDIALVGIDEQPVRCRDGVTLHPSRIARDTPTPDLVMVPALDDEDMPAALDATRHWVPWLKTWRADGALMASSCIGAFLLADAGILDGRPATTHWMFADLLHQLYPNVRVTPDQLIVDAGDVITCGGATSFLALVLHLVERFGGHERAALASKILLIDGGRTSQLPYYANTLQPAHDDDLIGRVQDHLEAHLSTPVDVEALSRTFNVSPRTLTRRFRSATGHSPHAYLQQARINLAKRLLETTNDPIDQIRAAAGYLDPASFRRAFRHAAGTSPSQYRKTYGPRRILPPTQ
jgi:transcriptional regulator GlxA family with amidase domain